MLSRCPLSRVRFVGTAGQHSHPASLALVAKLGVAWATAIGYAAYSGAGAVAPILLQLTPVIAGVPRGDLCRPIASADPALPSVVLERPYIVGPRSGRSRSSAEGRHHLSSRTPPSSASATIQRPSERADHRVALRLVAVAMAMVVGADRDIVDRPGVYPRSSTRIVGGFDV